MPSPETSRTNGLKGGGVPGKKPKTLAREAAQREYLRKEGISAARVLEEYRRLAFGDLAELYDEHGALKPLRSLPRAVRAMVAGVKSTKKNLVAGDGVQEDVVEVKLWDKIKALDSLAKHLGLLDEHVHVDVTVSDTLNAIKRRNRARLGEGAPTLPDITVRAKVEHR